MMSMAFRLCFTPCSTHNAHWYIWYILNGDVGGGFAGRDVRYGNDGLSREACWFYMLYAVFDAATGGWGAAAWLFFCSYSAMSGFMSIWRKFA
jgi:hypothetical protein